MDTPQDIVWFTKENIPLLFQVCERCNLVGQRSLPLYSFNKHLSLLNVADRDGFNDTERLMQKQHKQQNERHMALCPRFIAHMATNPDEHYSKAPSNKSADHPGNGKNQYGEPLSSTKSRWNTSAYLGGRQRQTTQVILPRCVLKNVPMRPVPSTTSSDGEPDMKVEYVQSPKTPDDAVICAPHKKEQNSSTKLMIAAETASYSNSEETIKLCNQETLCSLKSTKNDLELSGISMNEISSIYADREDSDLSGRVSGCSSIYRSCSTPFSQLWSSSSSLSLNMVYPSRSEEAFNNSSSRVSEQEKKALLSASDCYNNVPSPGLNNNSCYDNIDLYQASSNSLRKSSQASDFASSFDEMWHDRFLHHWPVLPPISPQRAFSESGNVGETDRRSKMSEFSNSVQDAFDELEMIAPHTGSSQSLENLQSGSDEDLSSVSDICRYTSSLAIGFSNPKESLADCRLALLNHTSCGKEDYSTEIGNAWTNNVSMDSGRNRKDFMTFPTQGPLFPPAPGVLNAPNTPETYSNKEDDHQQNIYTIFTGDEDFELKTKEELCHQTGSHLNNCSTKDYLLFSASGSSNILEVPKPDKDLFKENNGNHFNNRNELQPQPRGRKWPVKLDHSIKQEMERQRLAEERRAQAVNLYSKLRSSRSTAIRTTQSMNISRFEDFDFLAKYCIFSQEKLAEYKRAFEAVDTDEDGYLDCLQVLMALKEIVPANALSDAEELYVYRILEIVDYYVTDGLTDLRLFAVMASLAQKIAALDSFMRSLIDHMDFKALEMKMCKAKQLFLCNIDAESKSISVDQLLVELKAGGISREHEEAAQLELSNIKKLDILDFLTYLPLFVLIHNSVISNPLDDSRKM